MRLFRLIIDAGFILLGSTAAAEAAPVVGLFGAFAGWLGSGGILSGIVGGVLKLGIGLGASYLAQSLLGRKQSQRAAGGSSGKMQSGGTVPRSFILGRAMTAGSLVYVDEWGEADKTPNAFVTMVIALSDLPVKGLAEVWVNGSKVTYIQPSSNVGMGVAIPEYRNGDKDHLWIRFHDGSQTEADSFLVSKFEGHPSRPWNATFVGHGVAYAVITARVSETLWSGYPQPKFVLDGIWQYDVREDSSAGGDGAQAWGDPASWSAASRNPIVQAYNVVRGIRFDGKWVFGGQTVGGYQLPISTCSAAMNVCDVAVGKMGGGTEPQYEAGGEVTFDTEPADLLEELMKSCNGRMAEIGGIYKPRAGAPGTSIFHFTDDDILSTDPQTLEPFPSLAAVINAVTAKYVEPREGWAVKDAPPLYSPALELQDDGRRQVAAVTYGMVSSGTQTQRLMKSARDEVRRFRQHAIPMPPDAFLLEPNDFASWTSKRNGYVTKLFRIDAVQDLANLNIGLNLTEVDPSDYSWLPSVDERPIVSGPTAIVRPPAQVIVDFSASPMMILGDLGRAKAGIRLAWDPDIDDVNGVQFEIRLASDGTMIYQGETDRWDAGAIIISQNLTGLTAYQVHARYRPASPRDTAWSGWLNVTTPDVSEGLSEQERYELALNTNDARGSMQEMRNALDELVAQLALAGAESAGEAYEQRAAIRGNLTAAIKQVTKAMIDGDAAIASQVTTIAVKADQATAGGFVKFEAMASKPAGVTARFQVYLDAGVPGTPDWKDAGFLLDIVGGVARCVISVDKFFVTDGTTGFVIQGGLLTAVGGKLEIDLMTGRILGYREV